MALAPWRKGPSAHLLGVGVGTRARKLCSRSLGTLAASPPAHCGLEALCGAGSREGPGPTCVREAARPGARIGLRDPRLVCRAL